MSTIRKKVSVGGLCQAEDGRILLVNPTYKDRWDLPGGILEAGESPVAGLRREIREELSVDCRVGPLGAVDYGRADWEDAEVIMLTFHVELEPGDPERFRLQDGELSEVRFVEVEKALEMVTPRMRDRLRVALGLVPDGPHGMFVWRPEQP